VNGGPHTAPGLSLLVHRPGHAPTRVHTGLANVEHRVPITSDTTFNTGSVAKQITAHLVLLAARDNLLHLDQPAADLLPRLQVTTATIADLITHHSGLRDAESLLSLAGFRDLDHYTAADLIALAYRQRRSATPPGHFLYANTNYLLLAAILESVHDSPLNDIARTRLFSPLGMTSTCFKADPRTVIPHAAAAYRRASHGWRHTQTPVTLPGPGSVWTTADDLDRWLAHLHQERQANGLPLPAASTIAYRPSDHHPYLYGPGLYADPRPGHAAVFHWGHEQGFSAAAHLDATGLRVITLSNNADAPADHAAATVLQAVRDNPGADLGDALARATQVRAPLVQPAPSGDPDAALHRELGTFTCPEAPGVLRLTRVGETLVLWRRGTRDQLRPTAPTTYSGGGCTIMLASETDRQPPPGFILDLDRAPGLVYTRRDP